MAKIVFLSAHRNVHAALRGSPSPTGALVDVLSDQARGPTMSDVTPEARIAASMEDISRYIGEIKQLLQELAARPDVDNEQLARIAAAASEIERLLPAMLLR